MELESHLTALCLPLALETSSGAGWKPGRAGMLLGGETQWVSALHITQQSRLWSSPCPGGSSGWQPGAPPVQVGRGLQWQHRPPEGALGNCTLGLADLKLYPFPCGHPRGPQNLVVAEHMSTIP